MAEATVLVTNFIPFRIIGETGRIVVVDEPLTNGAGAIIEMLVSSIRLCFND